MQEPFDFEIEPGVWFGDWLLGELRETVHFETDERWRSRVRTPSARLQADRPEEWRFEVHVPWFQSRIAFVAPGRHIYFGRGLLERLNRTKLWLWQRGRGYLPVYDRERILREHLRRSR